MRPTSRLFVFSDKCTTSKVSMLALDGLVLYFLPPTDCPNSIDQTAGYLDFARVRCDRCSILLRIFFVFCFHKVAMIAKIKNIVILCRQVIYEINQMHKRIYTVFSSRIRLATRCACHVDQPPSPTEVFVTA